MARVTVRVPRQPRRRQEPESTSEGPTQSESKAEDAVTEDKSSSTETSSSTSGVKEEKAEGKKQEKAKGKRPMETKKRKQDNKDIDEMVKHGKGKAKGIVIGEAKKPETKAGGKPKSVLQRGWRRRRAFVVRSTYSLRSGLKGDGVEEGPTEIGGRKRKANEQEADDAEGNEVVNGEGTCKRIKKERNGDDRSDDDTDGGGGVGRDLPGSNAGAAIVEAV